MSEELKIKDFLAGSKGFSSDSRDLQPGQIFVALKGEHFDGNAFIDSALEVENVKVTAILGGLLAALILFLFLRDLFISSSNG